MQIRHAYLKDTKMMANLHSACFEKGWRERDFTIFFDKPDTYVSLIAERGEAAFLGFVCASCQADEAEILTLCVTEDHRRNGVAKKLMAKLIEELKKMDLAYLFLEVSQENISALNLYHSLGFQKVGLRPSYSSAKDGGRADAYVMKYSL